MQVLFGAGAEEEHILHLINGCEIIIATPPCFLRMLKKGYTRLDRLCHLVFDDADILAEEWTECIKEFMRTYGGKGLWGVEILTRYEKQFFKSFRLTLNSLNFD